LPPGLAQGRVASFFFGSIDPPLTPSWSCLARPSTSIGTVRRKRSS